MLLRCDCMGKSQKRPFSFFCVQETRSFGVKWEQKMSAEAFLVTPFPSKTICQNFMCPFILLSQLIVHLFSQNCRQLAHWKSRHLGFRCQYHRWESKQLGRERGGGGAFQVLQCLLCPFLLAFESSFIPRKTSSICLRS